MTPSQTQPEQNLKSMLKATLCVAAPAVVPFVMLISINAVSMLSLTGLGRLGVAAIGVAILCLANLFWRGRWWAALPSLLAFAAGMVSFAWRFARPFLAYIKVNPINDITDLGPPFMMLSPSLVVILICFTMGLVTVGGIRLMRQTQPRRVNKAVWGILFLWLAVLAGDMFYQQQGWRFFNYPSALVVRLCQGDRELTQEATRRLLQVGPPAVEELLLGINSKDPDLGCLREEGSRVIRAMGPDAADTLLKAALSGDRSALGFLAQMRWTKAVDPLLNRYRNPDKKDPPEYRRDLKQTIEKLDPTIKLGG